MEWAKDIVIAIVANVEDRNPGDRPRMVSAKEIVADRLAKGSSPSLRWVESLWMSRWMSEEELRTRRLRIIGRLLALCHLLG
jgi:hypothetical protein